MPFKIVGNRINGIPATAVTDITYRRNLLKCQQIRGIPGRASVIQVTVTGDL